MVRTTIQRLRKNEVVPTWLYIAMYLVMLYLVFLASKVDAWDIHRYYDEIDLQSKSHSFWTIISMHQTDHIDFVYIAILSFCNILGVPYHFISALIVTVFYTLILKIIRENFTGKIEGYIFFVALFATPIVWVLEISRNLTAYMFFYYALLFYYRNKWKPMTFFLILGVFTHFSTLMYIPFFVLAWLLKRVRVKSWIVILVMGTVFIFAYFVPDYINTTLGVILSGDVEHYARHTENEILNFLEYGNLNYGYITLILYCVGLSFVLLILNKKQGFEYWSLFFLTALLSFFLNSNQGLMNRCMMLMPVFWAVNIASIYTDGVYKQIQVIKMVSIVGLVVLFLYIYSLRNFFFPFFYGEYYNAINYNRM